MSKNAKMRYLAGLDDAICSLNRASATADMLYVIDNAKELDGLLVHTLSVSLVAMTDELNRVRDFLGQLAVPPKLPKKSGVRREIDIAKNDDDGTTPA